MDHQESAEGQSSARGREGPVTLDHRRQLQVANECVRGLLEGQIAINASSLYAMEAVNNDAIGKYRDLDVYCREIEKNMNTSRDAEEQLAQFACTGGELEAIERELDRLEALAKELDEATMRLSKEGK